MLLGIDIGGTAVKMGLLDWQGNIYASAEESVSFDGYKTPILDTVIRAAEEFLAREMMLLSGAVEFEGEMLEGIGVSATGQIDTRQGIVAGTNGKIANYEGAQIKAEMEDRFHVPVWVLNDANAAALGECFRGGGVGCKDVLMITLGTGVGGGLVLGGKVYEGARGFAGELGHFTLYQDGVLCACGKRGCYESYAATTALVRRSRMTSGREVFARAEKGDPQALSVLKEWINDIAAGLTGLIHIFNPERVLIGGGVSVQAELLMRPLREKVLSGVMPRFAEGLEILPAELGNDAGMIGAVRYWMMREEEENDR